LELAGKPYVRLQAGELLNFSRDSVTLGNALLMLREIHAGSVMIRKDAVATIDILITGLGTDLDGVSDGVIAAVG
jgi:hypothetical protein